MGTGLNLYMPFYSSSTPIPPMIHSGHPYFTFILGQKLSLKIQNLFQILSIFPSSPIEFGELSDYIY